MYVEVPSAETSASVSALFHHLPFLTLTVCPDCHHSPVGFHVKLLMDLHFMMRPVGVVISPTLVPLIYIFIELLLQTAVNFAYVPGTKAVDEIASNGRSLSINILKMTWFWGAVCPGGIIEINGVFPNMLYALFVQLSPA